MFKLRRIEGGVIKCSPYINLPGPKLTHFVHCMEPALKKTILLLTAPPVGSISTLTDSHIMSSNLLDTNLLNTSSSGPQNVAWLWGIPSTEPWSRCPVTFTAANLWHWGPPACVISSLPELPIALALFLDKYHIQSFPLATVKLKSTISSGHTLMRRHFSSRNFVWIIFLTCSEILMVYIYR